MRPTQSLVLLLLVMSTSIGARCRPASTKAPPVTAKALPRSAHPSPLGTNLLAVADYSDELPFKDLFKQSRRWISHTSSTWDDERPIDVDAHGWPKRLGAGQQALSLISWSDTIDPPLGEYVVTWRGKGVLDFWPQRVTSTKEVVVDGQAGGRAVISVEPKKGGIAIAIKETDATDPVRDIHIVQAADEATMSTAPFRAPFLERLRPYSVIRFMDWMQTNSSPVGDAKTLPAVDDARYTMNGVPAEVMVDLVNTLGADPWFTIPHTWTDAGVQRFAEVVKARLDKKLHVWIEHSNEVWNGMFSQGNALKDFGLKKGLGNDLFEAQMRGNAARSVEIFSIFEKIFGADQGRLVRVLGSQASNAWVSETMLNTPGVLEHTDALAIAPYFGGQLTAKPGVDALRTTPVDVLFEADMKAALDEAIGWMKAQKVVADRYGVPLVAYEGGQHLAAYGDAQNDARINSLFDSANRHPGMKAAYTRYLAAWKDSGGSLFVHYAAYGAGGKYGRWGAQEPGQTRKDAPKLDALLDFASGTPRWW